MSEINTWCPVHYMEGKVGGSLKRSFLFLFFFPDHKFHDETSGQLLRMPSFGTYGLRGFVHRIQGVLERKVFPL